MRHPKTEERLRPICLGVYDTIDNMIIVKNDFRSAKLGV